ncbi:MAG: molybdopterin-dependent oxidoreductase [Candidatus Atabeyarchaeum deiterrae]
MPRPGVSFSALVGLFALPLILVLVIGYAPAAITPNSNFFTLSINGTPNINVSSWTLVVDGRVNYPLTFDYANFTVQPNATEIAKLHCVSGPSGTASWTGIPLNNILAMAGVQSGAMDVVFYGADGYTSSLTWPTENASDVLLAFMMNGETLPPDQGFPMRVVAPNDQGYKWVKWVYRIEVVDYDYKGYWETRGWSDNARMAILSDWPLHAALLSVSFLFGGLAAISGVRFSPTMNAFKDLPRFVSRKFHLIASVFFVVSATITFGYWVVATLLARGSIFFTLHGIIGLSSIGLLIAGALIQLVTMRRSSAKRSWHGRMSLYGFVLFAITIFLGFLMAA